MNEGLKRKARLVFLVILAVLGAWRLGVGVLSQLDDKLLWFDDEATLGAAKESLTEPMAKMYELCTGVQGHGNLVLDPQSADDLVEAIPYRRIGDAQLPLNARDLSLTSDEGLHEMQLLGT